MANHTIAKGKSGKSSRYATRMAAVSLTGLLIGSVSVLAGEQLQNSADEAVRAALRLAAESMVFVDGHRFPDGSDRMLTQLTGDSRYVVACPATPCSHLGPPGAGTVRDLINDTSVYPATMGVIDGLKAPSANASITDGQVAMHSEIEKHLAAGDGPVTAVGYSLGASAASHEVSQWQTDGPVRFVLIGDGERPNGGLAARFPAHTFIPGIGMTLGYATPADAAPVVMVSLQYDGVADFPAYPANLLAVVNALLGAALVHGNGYYGLDPNAPGNVVTTSPDGNMTDILVPAAPGELPMFLPLAHFVPKPILVALDPAFRAVIETGYLRTADPAKQVRFGLLPPVSMWGEDVRSVVAGFVTTAEELPGAVIDSITPHPASTSPPADSGVATVAQRRRTDSAAAQDNTAVAAALSARPHLLGLPAAAGRPARPASGTAPSSAPAAARNDVAKPVHKVTARTAQSAAAHAAG